MKVVPPKEYRTLSEKLSLDRQLGSLTDVTFIVGKDEHSSSFKAHKIVLANGNPTFAKLFQEKSTDLLNEPIRIKELKPTGFGNLLDFLYDQEFELPDLKTAFETFAAACKYKVPVLMRCMQDFVIQGINRDNAVSILRLAVKLKMHSVERKSSKIIQENADYILSSHEFIKLPWDMVERITALENLKASKVQVMYAIVRWKNANYVYSL